MKFAVLADAHIGRSIPLAIAEYRREAFSRAFSKSVDAIIAEGADYVFFCGDLFERRTLRPRLVQFAHDELYRLARETLTKHEKKIKIFIVRGNHDGRPQSDALDYIKHPLAEYLVVFDEGTLTYRDDTLEVIGLSYYDECDRAFEELVKPIPNTSRMRVILLHNFVSNYHEVPPGNSSISLDQLADASPQFAFAGHYHSRCPPRRLSNGGWLLTPGSLEMYDFAEHGDKGFYIIEDAESQPEFRWMPVEPLHTMKQIEIKPNEKQSPNWYRDRIGEAVVEFVGELKRARKRGYLRIVVKGELSEGFPSDITLDEVQRIRRDEPFLLWVDVDTMELDAPRVLLHPNLEQVNVAEFFSPFGDFARNIQEMHMRVGETLEEEASVQTGLLTPIQRTPLIKEWLKHFEEKRFEEEQK